MNEVLDLIVLVANNHLLCRIDDPYVDNAVVFTLRTNALSDPLKLSDSGTFTKPYTLGFRDLYRHRRAVNGTEQYLEAFCFETNKTKLNPKWEWTYSAA